MFWGFACPGCGSAPEYPPVVRPGDVWKMGCRHCGTQSWYDAAGELLHHQPADEPRERDIVAAPVEGWRLWRVGMASGPGPPWLLGSVGLDRHVWDAPVMEARHLNTGTTVVNGFTVKGAPSPCESPDLHCHCGFWAFKQLGSLWEHCVRYSMARQELWAFGKVEMWGRLVEHQNGWRAQFIRPVEVELAYYEGAFIRKEDAAGRAELVARHLAQFYRCRARVVTPDDVKAIMDGETKRQVMAAASSVPWASFVTTGIAASKASGALRGASALHAQLAQSAHQAAQAQAQLQTLAQVALAQPPIPTFAPRKDPWWMRILHAMLAAVMTAFAVANFQAGGWLIVVGLLFALIGGANARKAWRGW